MFVYSPSKQSPPGAAVRRDDVRANNTALLLRMIWNSPEGSARTDLAKGSGLSRATVSGITQDLLDSGLVQEGDRRASRGGRPATVLRFHDGGAAIIGVELGASHVSAVRVDLRGHIQDSARQEHDVQGDPDGALTLFGRFTDRLVQGATAPVLGVGVGVPSPLRLDQPGRLSPHLLPRWRHIDVRSWFTERLGLPVRIDNDANVGALAEHWWGAGRDFEDFAYIKVATGVGAGIISGGRILRGAGGIAGEIGHTAIDPNGPRCRCGLFGCLEAFVGTQYLLQRAHALPGNPAWVTPDMTLNALVDAANRGEPEAAELLRATGHWLGVAVSNLLNLLNPGRVVLGGRLMTAGPLILDPLRASLAERSLWTSLEGARVVTSQLPREGVALGAATLVLQEALSEPHRLLSRNESTS